jgi:hypothetical protein
MSDSKNNYIVCELEDPEEGFLKIVQRDLSSTREAERWIRESGNDGFEYVVVKMTRQVRVETVTRRKLTSL